jgi:5-methylcytosine-specific restriction protein A
MNRTAETLLEQAVEYVHLLDRFSEIPSDEPIRLATDHEIIDALASIAHLRRVVQAEETKLAGEVARRSEPRDETAMARKFGASSAANLVAHVTGMPRATAGTVVASGEAFRAQENPFTGERRPARFAQVADAFADGLLDPEIAAAMRRTLAKAAPGLAPFEVDRLEMQVLAVSQEGWDADTLLAYLKQVPEHAHPDGGAPRGDEPAPTQTVRRRALQNGLIRWTAELDAVTDGFFTTAIDANTAIRRSLLTTPDQSDSDTADRRPLEQRRVDGLRLLATKALKMDDGQFGGTAVTLLVTIPEEALTTGLGTAELPDCGTTIPASTARMLAADAHIIPVVLGGKSQPLDLGTGRRYFTEAQRRAMAVRDGGCVGPGCDAPPSWCDGAHIRPAGYGRTSLENGVLLCWRCHLLQTCRDGNSNGSINDGGGHRHPGSSPPAGNDPADASHPSTSSEPRLAPRVRRSPGETSLSFESEEPLKAVQARRAVRARQCLGVPDFSPPLLPVVAPAPLVPPLPLVPPFVDFGAVPCGAASLWTIALPPDRYCGSGVGQPDAPPYSASMVRWIAWKMQCRITAYCDPALQPWAL